MLAFIPPAFLPGLQYEQYLKYGKDVVGIEERKLNVIFPAKTHVILLVDELIQVSSKRLAWGVESFDPEGLMLWPSLLFMSLRPMFWTCSYTRWLGVCSSQRAVPVPLTALLPRAHIKSLWN